MINLGLLQSNLPPDIIVKCAESVKVIFNKDKGRGFKRIKLLLGSIKKEQSDLCALLKDIPFLPVLSKPKDFILPWKGDGHDLLPPSQVIAVESTYDLKKYGNTVGSQKAIINTSEEGCGLIQSEILSLFKIPNRPSLEDVLNHFQCLIDFCEIKSGHELHDKIRQIDTICHNVYEFLDKSLTHPQSYGNRRQLYSVFSTNLSVSKQRISRFSNKPFIWTEKVFVTPTDVSKNWNKCNGPCLYKLPSIISKHTALLEALNIKNNFDARKLLSTFRQLHTSHNSHVLPSDYHVLCDSIIAELNSLVLSDEELKMITNEGIYLVDNKYVVRLSSDLLYNDTQWLAPYDNIDDHYVHSHLLRNAAIKLGVTPTCSKFLEQYTSTSQNFKGIPFGQKEDLTDRITNILRDYPFDIAFIKELIQNADDAKATKMCIILDKRQHGTKRIISEEWKELQGPAILVWNDKNFTDKDIEGIQKLGVGSKRDDDESIGQFGIGFNVVYHLTDCPSFITRGNTLCVFDPHCHYVPGANLHCPGRQYNIEKSFWDNMSDLRTAYLQDELPGKPPGLDSGVLFRFPLRCTEKHIRESKLITDKVNTLPPTASNMERYLRDWILSIKEALLFLNNLTQFDMYIIEKDSRSFRCNQIASYSVVLTDNDSQIRTNFKETCRNFKSTRESKHIIYPLTIKTNGDNEEQWLIQQGVGDASTSVSNWEFLKQTIPKHGIAAPLIKSQDFKGKLFCFLPLPVYTNLPVHINGQFVLSSNRRSLWNSTKQSDSKAKWNDNLIKAIAYSYAKFLCKAREYYVAKEKYEKVDDFYSNINQYYSLFPFWDPPLKGEEKKVQTTGFLRHLITGIKAADSFVQQAQPSKLQDWNGIGHMIFIMLWSMNDPILVCEVHQSNVIIPQWHVFHNDDIPHEQAYFLPRTELFKDVKVVLRNIGMKLTCAPYTLYEHLKEFNPAITSPQSVYQYYTQFHPLVIKEYPCLIKDTPFKNAQNFCKFLSYVLVRMNAYNIMHTFPSNPNNAPLLLTADLQLRGFSNSQNTLMSKYYRLFEKSSNQFLHPKILNLFSKISSDYFASENNTSFHVIDDIMKSNYPLLSQDNIVDNSNQHVITDEALKDLWKCLNDDPIFHYYESVIVRMFTLIPSCDQKLFNSSSSILPIIEPQSLEYYEKVFKLLKIFGLPKYNSTISCHAEKYCLKMNTDLSQILSALYIFHKKNNIDSFLNTYPQAADLFLDYFGRIDFRYDHSSLQCIKQLPLFVTVTNEKTSIAGKEFYVWPAGFCTAGYGKWAPIDRTIFLKPDGKWRSLCNSNIEAIGGKNINERDIYLNMIFPVFDTLTDKERKDHLLYIKNCIIVHFDVYASNFLSVLKNLKCIKSKDGNLSTVSFFCHHKIPIFSFFSDRFEFVPKEYQTDEWINFLCNLGLKQSVTIEEFTKLCLIVSKGHCVDIRGASTVLVKYLFSKSAKAWHTNQLILSKIGDICFVQVDPLTNLKWIKEPCQPPKYFPNEKIGLTKLNESVISDSAAIVWTVKPVVSLQNYFLELFCGLSITVKPKIEDVYQNLINISNSGIANFDLFSKYRPDFVLKENSSQVTIETIITQTLSYLFKYRATILLQKLSTVPCIPVPVDSTCTSVIGNILKPVLVKPLQVVRYITRDSTVIFPYVHVLPSFINVVQGDLKLIGILDTIEIKTLQYMLQFIYERQQNTKLDPNNAKRVRTAILTIHKLCSDHSDSEDIKDLKPLYYPNEQLKLKDTAELVFIDSHRYNARKLNFSGLLFYLPKVDDTGIKVQRETIPDEKSICLNLPKNVRPKSLSFVCTEELVRTSESNKDCQLSLHFNKLKSIAPSLEELFCKVLAINNITYSSELSSSFVQLVTNITVKTMTPLKCVVKIESHKLGEIDVPYLIQQHESGHVLYVDFETSLGYSVFNMLSHSICIEIARNRQYHLAKYFKSAKFIGEFLKITSHVDLIEKYSLENVAISDVPVHIRNDDYVPALEKKIPDDYVALLYEGDIDHVFQPEEWVGYELAEGYIVYAIILYPVIDSENMCTSSAIAKKYKICINDGEDGEKIVSALDLYKFIVKSPMKEADSQEMVISELNSGGLGTELRNVKDSFNLIEIKKKICHELTMIWALENENEKKKAIKRLYIKYHPDKANPNEHDLYDEAFKFLTRQIARLEEGLSLEDPQRHSKSDPIITFESSKWTNIYSQWNTYVPKTNFTQSTSTSSSGRYSGGSTSQYSSTYAGVNTSQWNPPQPTCNVDEAKRWLRQAESDMKAMRILKSFGGTQACCQVLFLAHETCEKSLKGGMYAFYGLNSGRLKDHILGDHALALSSRGGELAKLPQLINPKMEIYYLRTRFPNQIEGLLAPVDVYTDEGEARDVASRAEKVYELIRDSVYNGN